MRWLVALISDTGMRLAEASGCTSMLEGGQGHPTRDIKPHPCVIKDQRQSEASASGSAALRASQRNQGKMRHQAMPSLGILTIGSVEPTQPPTPSISGCRLTSVTTL
jgi:hypothetical protein